MIDRFRSSEPSSRDERLARREKGMIRELWFERGDTNKTSSMSRTIATTPNRERGMNERSGSNYDNFRGDRRDRRRDDRRDDQRDGRREERHDRLRDDVRNDGPYDRRDDRRGDRRDDHRDDRRDDRRGDFGDDRGYSKNERNRANTGRYDTRRDDRSRDDRRRDDRRTYSGISGRRSLREPQVVSSFSGRLPLELLTEGVPSMRGSMNNSLNGSMNGSIRGSMNVMGSLNNSLDMSVMTRPNALASVDDLIESDLMSSLGMPPRNNDVDENEKMKEDEPVKPPPPLPSAENGFNGTMPPLESLPGSLSLVAVNLENALMPFKQLYMRKEIAREESRERSRLMAAMNADPNPMESDIRAITAVNMAEAGITELGGSFDENMIMGRNMGMGGMRRGYAAMTRSVDSGTTFSNARGEAYSRALDALDVATFTNNTNPNIHNNNALGTMDLMFTDEDLPPPPPYTPVQPRDGALPQQQQQQSNVTDSISVDDPLVAESLELPMQENESTGSSFVSEKDLLQAKLNELETTARQKSSNIDASINDLKKNIEFIDTTINTNPLPVSTDSMPSTLAGAADHISERLDIAMFSITRRLRNQMAMESDGGRINDDTPSFLSRESDNDLRNITLEAMQAEAESTIMMKEQLEKEMAQKAFARAKKLSDYARNYDQLAAESVLRQSLRENEAIRHQRASMVAERNAREADDQLAIAKMNARSLEQQEALDPWVLEEYKEFTDVVPFNSTSNKKAEEKEVVVEEKLKEGGKEEEKNEEEKKEKEKKEEEKDVQKVDENTTNVENVITPEDMSNMSLMDRAKVLFQQKESIVDECINGVDAEIVLRELGASCVEGSIDVRKFTFTPQPLFFSLVLLFESLI
jgi:hypothetical protein